MWGEYIPFYINFVRVEGITKAEVSGITITTVNTLTAIFTDWFEKRVLDLEHVCNPKQEYRLSSFLALESQFTFSHRKWYEWHATRKVEPFSSDSMQMVGQASRDGPLWPQFDNVRVCARERGCTCVCFCLSALPYALDSSSAVDWVS